MNRDDLAERIRDAIEECGWRIREGDRWQIVILPPLATGRPERNRWPDEPEEGDEPIERDARGGFLDQLPQEAEPVRYPTTIREGRRDGA